MFERELKLCGRLPGRELNERSLKKGIDIVTGSFKQNQLEISQYLTTHTEVTGTHKISENIKIKLFTKKEP